MFKKSPKVKIKFHKPINYQVLQIVSNTLLFCGVYILILTYSGTIWAELAFRWDEFRGVKYQLEDPKKNTQEIKTEKILSSERERQVSTSSTVVSVKPVNTDFSILIESINVNAPIVRDVSVVTESVYMDALKKGVAHAAFSDYPSENAAQVYLFAHSSNNFWQLGPYSTVFNHLHKLKQGEKINLFYEGKRYVYQVDSITYTDNFKIEDNIFNNIGPVLILQTCYPAGTTQYRLILTSSLVEVSDYIL